MNILIIEDERPAAQKLTRLLKEISPGIHILDILGSVELSVNWISTHPEPDLIFMDIQLEDGLSFEIFEECVVHAPVVFTTAYDEYTLRAFKVNSVDYLLKPIAPEELKKALDKFNRLHTRHRDFSPLESLWKQLQPQIKERFLIRIGEHFRSVPTSRIHGFYVMERCTFLLTDTGKQYPVDFSLDKIEQMVDARLFFRVNRNFIVCFPAIQDILIYSSSRLKITLDGWSGKEEILVSRERVAAFKEWMDR